MGKYLGLKVAHNQSERVSGSGLNAPGSIPRSGFWGVELSGTDVLKEHEAVVCQAGPAFTESTDFCSGIQTESTVSIARPCLGTKDMQS